MWENEISIRAFRDSALGGLMERHPWILNLLLGAILISLSLVAIFLASDIVSSGSHEIHEGGLGGQIIQIPEEALETLNNLRSEIFAKEAISGLNRSNNTDLRAAGNERPAVTAVLANTSPDGPAVALPKKMTSTAAAITSNATGSTNGAAPIKRRHNSDGSRPKKADGNVSKINESILNGSQITKIFFSDESQLNGSTMNESGSALPSLNKSQISNMSQRGQPLAVRSHLSNTSRLNQSMTNGTESSNRSRLIASQPLVAQVTDSSKNRSQQDKLQPNSSKSVAMNEPDGSQSGIADPMKGSRSIESPPNQSLKLNRPGKTGVSSEAETAGNNGTNNQTSALAAPSETPASQKMGEGQSAQIESQKGSSSSLLSDHSSAALSGADAGSGGDKPVIKTLKFASEGGSKVSADSAETSSKTVSASKSSAKTASTEKTTSKQYRPTRAPRKPASPRQARSTSRE